MLGQAEARARHSLWASPPGGRDRGCGPSSTALPGALAGSWIRRAAGTQSGTQVWDASSPVVVSLVGGSSGRALRSVALFACGSARCHVSLVLSLFHCHSAGLLQAQGDGDRGQGHADKVQ